MAATGSPGRVRAATAARGSRRARSAGGNGWNAARWIRRMALWLMKAGCGGSKSGWLPRDDA